MEDKVKCTSKNKIYIQKKDTVVKLYRLAHLLYKINVPFLPYIIQWTIRRMYCADIPYKMMSGKFLHLGHSGLGIVIHPRCVIGENVTIAQQVTIGGNKGSLEVPRIGNDVYIGPGAKLLGGIIIGNNVIIGANAVVLKSVPDNVVVAGVPGKILREVRKDDIYR